MVGWVVMEGVGKFGKDCFYRESLRGSKCKGKGFYVVVIIIIF